MKLSIIPIVSMLTLASLENIFFSNKKNEKKSTMDELSIYFERSNPNIPNEYLEKISIFLDNYPSDKTLIVKSFCALEKNDKCKKAIAQQRISRVMNIIKQKNEFIKINQRIIIEGGSIQIRQGQINTEKICLYFK